jgi:hypothetical protein
MLFKYFEEIHIIKPAFSRPANSERYVVFKRFNPKHSMFNVMRIFEDVLRLCWKKHGHKNDNDCYEIIRKSMINNDFNIDDDFKEFITNTNYHICNTQVSTILKRINKKRQL